MCLTNKNVKQNNVYFERVCKLHCAVHCVIVEGAGRGLWACKEVTHGSEMNICLLRSVMKKGGGLERVCM